MRESITPYDIANQVRMMRPVFTGTALIVEGDTDARTYRRFIDGNRCRIVPAHGKSNAINAVCFLDESGHKGVLAIVDSDFWRLEGTRPPGDNVLATDTHDLETMIISSESLDVVLAEFGSPNKLSRLDGDIRGVLLDAAKPIGYIRWISGSTRDNLSLRFKNLSFEAVIETRDDTVTTNIDILIREVRSHSRSAHFSTREMKTRIGRLIDDDAYDPWQVCRGHDMVHILTIALREVFGNRHARTISYDQVDRILRIAYGIAQFSRTRLYASIRAWEKQNGDYRVLEAAEE